MCCPLEHAVRSQGFLEVLHGTGCDLETDTRKGARCAALARDAVSACDAAAPARHILRHDAETFLFTA